MACQRFTPYNPDKVRSEKYRAALNSNRNDVLLAKNTEWPASDAWPDQGIKTNYSSRQTRYATNDIAGVDEYLLGRKESYK